MQTLNIEESSATRSNMEKVTTFAREGHVILVAFAASLGFLSIGYHLSVFNSISVFLWQGDPSETNYYTFKTVCDAILALSVFVISGVLSCNKIKFPYFRKLLIIADAFMILGTLTSFAIFSPHVNWLYIGRFVVGEAVAINIAIIPPFVREAQFYLSESNFKTEKRRFFIDILFAFGVFLGFTPSQLLSQVAEHDVYIEGNYDYENLTYIQRPDLFSCYVLCLIPIAASIVRIILFVYLGEVKPPQYAPAFNDEGLSDAFEEEEDTGRLYMLKFKETKSLLKLLEEPYRRRMELCYILYFLQVISGFVIFIVNPALLVTFFQQRELEDLDGEEVQFTILEFGAIYLLTTLIVSFLFTMTKIKRKLVMSVGNVLATVTALALGGSSLFGFTDNLKTLLLVYWFASSLGLGTAMETFVEEVIPAKGLQFLLSIKYLLVCVIGVITSYSLSYHITYIPLYLFLFVIGLMALFVIFDLTPETADVDPRDIHKLFEFEDEQEEKSGATSGEDNMNSTVAST